MIPSAGTVVRAGTALPGLAGAVILVTGGSRGIGLALCRALAEQGAHPVPVARNREALDTALDGIRERDPGATGVSADVRDGAAMERAVEEVLDRHGRLDGLVNNAGIARDALLLRMSDEAWGEVMDTNLRGVFAATRAAVRPMIKARRGRIVNVTSVVGLTGNAGQANYAAAKAGIIGFTKSIAREVASRGITVNAIAPGFVETDMTASIPSAERERLLERIPLGRYGTGADVAGAALFLLSDAAAYVTGAVLRVDGGLAM